MKRTEQFIKLTDSIKMHAQEFDNCCVSLIFINAFCELLNVLSEKEQDEFFQDSPEIKELCDKWSFLQRFVKEPILKRRHI